mgnify:CR=1 FL=1
MTGHVVILSNPDRRAIAHRVIDAAPVGSVVEVSAPQRTVPQNKKMWSMLGDVSRAKPDGKMATPETWKVLFMHKYGFQMRFEEGIDGDMVPMGYSSSLLTKGQMTDFIETIYEFGARKGITWDGPGQ